MAVLRHVCQVSERYEPTPLASPRQKTDDPSLVNDFSSTCRRPCSHDMRVRRESGYLFLSRRFRDLYQPYHRRTRHNIANELKRDVLKLFKSNA